MAESAHSHPDNRVAKVMQVAEVLWLSSDTRVVPPAATPEKKSLLAMCLKPGLILYTGIQIIGQQRWCRWQRFFA